jgi:hypothetical protein
LKLQYQIIGQRLAVIKIKRSIQERQKIIGEECRNKTRQGLQQRIGSLLKVIDCAAPCDTQFMEQQRQEVLSHKRKLEEEENQAEQLQAVQRKVWILENKFEEEVTRRVDTGIGHEREQFEQYKTAELAKLQQTNEDLGAYAAQLAALAQDMKVDRTKKTELNAVAAQLTDVATELRGPPRRKAATKTKKDVEPETSEVFVISDISDTEPSSL